jgi:hypothetical protein
VSDFRRCVGNLTAKFGHFLESLASLRRLSF